MSRGRPNGGKNKCWSKEEKEQVVLYHLNNKVNSYITYNNINSKEMHKFQVHPL